MNPREERELEAAIDRELKALPNLRAPITLVLRVMAALEQQAARPWYHGAWQTWPLPLQALSLLALLTGFGGLCFAGWQFVHTPAFASACQEVTGWVGVLGAAWKALNVLASALGLAVKSLGLAVTIAGLGVVLLGYAACVALATAYVRLAWVRR